MKITDIILVTRVLPVDEVSKMVIELENDDERLDLERAIESNTSSMCVHKIWEALNNKRSGIS